MILPWLAGCLNRPCFHRAVRWSKRSHCSETTLSEAIDGRPDPILYGEIYCNGSCSKQSQMHIYIFIIYINYVHKYMYKYKSFEHVLLYTPNTHVCFHELNKTYFLLPYTNPTPKPTPYRKLCAFFVHTHTHTHTHTHVGFYGLRGLSIGVMVFILYKLYVLLPYT